MSTKHGSHGQVVTLYKWLNFGADPDPDVDLGSFLSLSLTLGDRHFIRYIFTHQRATLQQL